jgi:hypothetical protein
MVARYQIGGSPRGPRRRVLASTPTRAPALATKPNSQYARHVARMSQEPAERAGTGRDDTGRGGISTPKQSGRSRGKGAILLRVSHHPARVRFPPPHSRSSWVHYQTSRPVQRFIHLAPLAREAAGREQSGKTKDTDRDKMMRWIALITAVILASIGCAHKQRAEPRIYVSETAMTSTSSVLMSAGIRPSPSPRS